MSSEGEDDSLVALSWTEEGCEELWERVEGVRHKLTRILNPVKLTPYLRQCKVMDEQDEDEVLNSPQLPLRISKAGRLLDILRTRGQRGLQAFMESLEFYHPEQYTQLTGQQPTQRCSMMLDEEGHEGLTQFLLLEVRKLRQQLHHSRMCERRLSQRCRVAEDERSRAERKNQGLRQERIQLERLRQDCEAGARELGLLKERLLEQAVKYSRALEEQRKSSNRERELLSQVEQLKNRLLKPENSFSVEPTQNGATKNTCALHDGTEPLFKADVNADKAPAGQVDVLQTTDMPRQHNSGTEALLDILRQDQREAAEQRQELCSTIIRLQGELESVMSSKEKLEAQCKQFQLKVRTLQLDLEAEQKRSSSYFNQIMDLERERDQALRSRDSLQLEFTDCLLDKNRLCKQIAELQSSIEQLQREVEEEKEKNMDEETPDKFSCSYTSFQSLFSEEQCFEPCCSLGLTTHKDNHLQHKSLQLLVYSQNSENSDDSHYSSEENLLSPRNSAKDINRLSTFPFPPCINSIHRRVNTEFETDLWGSDESNIADSDSASLWDSCPPFHPNPTSSRTPAEHPPKCYSLPTAPPRNKSLVNDITIIGGNRSGIFVQTVRSGSAAEKCGLKEGHQLMRLEQTWSPGGAVDLTKCTSEVADFALQWWTEPSALKHQENEAGYSQLKAHLSSCTFTGSDSFYVRVNLDLWDDDLSCLRVTCNDVLYVTDTRHNGRYQWYCTRVDTHTGNALQYGAVPNYNRAQQMLLVKLRTLTQQQKQKKKKFSRKVCERVRLVKSTKQSDSNPSVCYMLQNHDEQLVPYSLVQMIRVETKRPVLFSPSLVSHGLIERLLQPADSGLYLNTCQPEPIAEGEQKDKDVFMLDHTHTSDQKLGVKLKSIQDVISQDKHCLLPLSVSRTAALLKHGIYPIIIHIQPKDKRGKKFRKLLGCVDEDEMMELVQLEELQLETLPLMFTTLHPSDWSCTNQLVNAVRNTIHSQQGAAVWIEPDSIQ